MKSYLLKLAVVMLLIFHQNVNAVEFALFGDVKFIHGTADEQKTEFALGQLDFFATSQIDDKSRVFVEYVFENGGHGLVVDLERLWVAREINNQLTLAAGRFHTPLGYWNRTYHHGSFMQDTVSRPFFLDFEDGAGGVLPVHVSGAMAWGTYYTSEGEISYEAFVANGSSINSDEFGFNANADSKPEIEINDEGDVNENKSLGFRLTFSPNETLGFSLFMANSDVAESGEGINSGVLTGEALLAQQITGLDFRAEKGNFDSLIEYYHFNNKSENILSGDHSGDAYFVQLGWRYSETFKTIFRHESLTFDEQDSYFALLGADQASRQLIAFRYDLSSTNAIKLEINHGAAKFAKKDTDLTFQWTFMVP